jgi:hypothetical protein
VAELASEMMPGDREASVRLLVGNRPTTGTRSTPRGTADDIADEPVHTGQLPPRGPVPASCPATPHSGPVSGSELRGP